MAADGDMFGTEMFDEQVVARVFGHDVKMAARIS